MSYQPGRMGVAEGIGLCLMVTLPRIFLTTPAFSIGNVKNLAWIEPLVATGGALAMFFLLFWVMRRVKGDFFTVCEKLLGRAGAWLITLFYIVVFIADAGLLLRQFAENTLITALPYAQFSLIILWYIFFAAALVYFGVESIARASYLILPFVVFGTTAVIVMLVPFYDVYRLLPWEGSGLGVALTQGLVAAGFNVGGLLLPILAGQFQNMRTLKLATSYGIGLSGLLCSLLVLFFILAFGVAQAEEKTLPFFEMARLVYLSRYLQRIEALFIIIWVVVGLVSIAINLYLALYLISRLLKLPSLQPLIPAVGFIVVNLAVIPPDINSVIELDGYLVTMFFSVAMYGPPALIVLAYLVKKRGGGLWPG